MTMMGLSGIQWVRTRAEVKADLRVSNDCWASLVKFHVTPLQVSQGKQNNNVRVVRDEAAVEVSKT